MENVLWEREQGSKCFREIHLFFFSDLKCFNKSSGKFGITGRPQGVGTSSCCLVHGFFLSIFPSIFVFLFLFSSPPFLSLGQFICLGCGTWRFWQQVFTSVWSRGIFKKIQQKGITNTCFWTQLCSLCHIFIHRTVPCKCLLYCNRMIWNVCGILAIVAQCISEQR